MLTYRPDIDGLRAIAVLSVLFYHLDETLLSGGFVGVDIFFVISGYLITKLIVNELRETGQFSFKYFYIRRVRRLFPALFATLALSLLVAGYLLSPAHLIEFAKSAVAAIASLSNLYFWSAAGYFDSQSQLKPLLHTWSLSVEEQFYLIWPAVLVGLFALSRKWVIPSFIVCMGILSLALNITVFAEQAEIASWFDVEDNQSAFDVHSTAFYWLPFRVFEFAIGAILVWLPHAQQRSKFWLPESQFIVGLGLIIYSVIELDSKIEFPSTAALYPCLGAGLMMLSGPNHRFAALVKNKVAVGIGLISYSLYLVHWPIIVFLNYSQQEPLGNIAKFSVVVASLTLAALFYKFVEQPFRKPKASLRAPHKRFLWTAAGAAGVMIAVNSHAVFSGGWLGRYPADVVAQLSYKKGDYTEYFWHNLYALEGDFKGNGKPKVLVIGDSMAADFVNVLVEGELAPQLDVATIAIGDNCKAVFPLNEQQYKVLFAGASEVCKKQHQKVLQNLALLQQADTIVLASYWWEYHWVNYVKSTTKFLAENSPAKVMVLGLKNQTSDGIWFLNKHSLAANIHKIRTPMHPQAATLNQKLRSHQDDYIYFDLLGQFCGIEGCQRVTEEGYVIVFDQAHLSEQGARFIGKRAKNASWFKLLKQRSSKAVKIDSLPISANY